MIFVFCQRRSFCFFGIFLFVLFVFSGNGRAETLLSGWSGDAFLGYNQSSGNTEKGSASLAAQAIKKFDNARLTLKGSFSYSESDNKMDSRKWDALARYSRDFGKDYRWFKFYQISSDHDHFADIAYRMTPAVGVGYHIFQTDDLVWDVDAGMGYRITRHRVNKAADDEVPTAVLHTFAKKKILQNSFISEDLTVYPGLTSDAGVILRSVTAFTNPINESLDLEIRYIVDYNSEPAEGKKNTDTQMIVGMKYKF